MKGKIIISGAKGFLGSNLVKLLKEDYAVFGIGRDNETIEGMKIFSSSQVGKIKVIPDFLILCHAAVSSGNMSPSSKDLFDSNVFLTQQLLEKFSSAKIIYISSASVYDADIDIISENSPVNPQSQYAVSKLWAEKLVLKSKNAAVFRLSSLYGIGMKENTIIPNYTNQAITNNAIKVWGNGMRMQNYISIQDACNYIKYGIQEFDSIRNRILLMVDQTEHSNNQLAEIIAQSTNAKIEHVNEDFSKSSFYSNDLTCSLLGWGPKSDFAFEIHKYVKWKKEQF